MSVIGRLKSEVSQKAEQITIKSRILEKAVVKAFRKLMEKYDVSDVLIRDVPEKTKNGKVRKGRVILYLLTDDHLNAADDLEKWIGGKKLKSKRIDNDERI